MECRVLRLQRFHWLVACALFALLFAQTAALLHQVGHAGGGADRPLLPGSHTSLCPDCVSQAPLLALAGAAALAVFLTLQVVDRLQPCDFRAPRVQEVRRAFRSRAPPR